MHSDTDRCPAIFLDSPISLIIVSALYSSALSHSLNRLVSRFSHLSSRPVSVSFLDATRLRFSRPLPLGLGRAMATPPHFPTHLPRYARRSPPATSKAFFLFNNFLRFGINIPRRIKSNLRKKSTALNKNIHIKKNIPRPARTRSIRIFSFCSTHTPIGKIRYGIFGYFISSSPSLLTSSTSIFDIISIIIVSTVPSSAVNLVIHRRRCRCRSYPHPLSLQEIFGFFRLVIKFSYFFFLSSFRGVFALLSIPSRHFLFRWDDLIYMCPSSSFILFYSILFYSSSYVSFILELSIIKNLIIHHSSRLFFIGTYCCSFASSLSSESQSHSLSPIFWSIY
ncbi:hypothetical protein BDN70DRAFT_622973 [Pholiota conissans]|uniref:Uncharacterized protein n=1 Tax=Pholiota conissans TaxID=109636 RepID=A0A9P6D1E9_9AGAR|nr:hypothetical protein BDN70DRAFT_622973 [Pholiota conissans]